MNEFIRKAYRPLSLRQRLHVALRYQTCPFMRIEEHIPKSGTLLDFGCGQGLFSWILKQTHPERRVIGYDKSHEKIATARAVTCEDCAITFVTDERYETYAPFDAIVVCDVLYLIQEKKDVIARLLSLLKPHGVLIVKEVVYEHSVRFLWAFLQEYIVYHLCKLTTGEGLFYEPKETYQQWLHEGNCDVTTIDLRRGYWYPHYLFIGKRK